MKKFLVINYNSPDNQTECVPYLWLTLRSYFLRNSKNPNAWEWLDPIYSPMGRSTEDLIERIVKQKPDVIGISCYMWNDMLTFQIIENVKKLLPNVKIIAGGPALYYERDISWFVKHWYIDAVCAYAYYGENFIGAYLDGEELKNIPGCVYPALRRAFWQKSNVELDRKNFNWPMPYLDNKEYLIRFKENHKRIKVLLDTSRGCPYGCTFCEWGGGTSTKVTFKSIEDVKEELNVIFEILQPMVLEFINANFGIVKDDLEYAKHIYDLNQQYKCVKDITLYGPTKTNKKILKSIYEVFIQGKMTDALKLSIQSTNNEVLKNIRRIDMPYDEQVTLFNELSYKYNVPLRFETMIGLPGETIDSYYNMLYDLSKSEFLYPLMHEWQMLPSAPASDPEYIQQMGLETHRLKFWHRSMNNVGFISRNRYTENKEDTGLRNILNDSQYIQPYEVVVKSYSYTKEEWAKMILVKHFFVYFSSNNITSPFYKYLDSIKKSDVKTFYKDFFEEFIFNQGVIKHCLQKIVKSLNEDDVTDVMYADINPNLPYIHYQSLYKFIILMDPYKFFDGLYIWLASKYGEDEYLKDLSKFIASNIKSPMTYNTEIEKRIDSQFDWKAWIKEKNFEKPPKNLNGYYVATDRNVGWDNKFLHRDRMRELISMCATWSESMFFDQVELFQN